MVDLPAFFPGMYCSYTFQKYIEEATDDRSNFLLCSCLQSIGHPARPDDPQARSSPKPVPAKGDNAYPKPLKIPGFIEGGQRRVAFSIFFSNQKGPVEVLQVR